VYPPPCRKCVKVFEPKGLSLNQGLEKVSFAGKVFDSGRLSLQGKALYFGARLVFIVLAVMFIGAGEFFEEVGVLDGRGDFVVAAGPFAEVDAAAAVGAEGEVFAAGEDQGAAGGAAQRFGFRGGRPRHTFQFNTFLLREKVGRGAVTDYTSDDRD
jgi:hypothetical protein